MADFLQTLLIAVTLGSLYALIALGYTMVYGVLKLINFAHSDVVVLGAWLSVTLGVFLLPFLGIVDTPPPWWAGGMVLATAMLLCGGIGFLIERLAYKPIRKAPRLNALITAIGVSLFLQNTGQLRYTILDNERVVASADSVDVGSAPRTIKLPTAVELEPGARYVARVHRKSATASTGGASGGGSNYRLAAAPGRYEAGQDLLLETTIGRAAVRDARVELLKIADYPPLQLPFGAMPTAMPPLFANREVAHAVYVRHVKWTTTEAAPSASGESVKPLVEEEAREVLVAAGFGATPSPLPESPPPSGWVASEQTRDDGARVRVEISQFPKPVLFTLLDLIIIGTAAALMVALQILVFRTTIGTAMRAVSFNMETSSLMGIPVNRVVSITFVTGSMLAAAAGFLYALRYQQVQQPAHATWVLLGLKAFVAAVVGGIGNIRGATVGGFLIAFIEQFGAYLGQQIGWQNASAYTDVFVFVLLIVVLLVKPTGIFGSTVREKV